jgi:hypothetical protein
VPDSSFLFSEMSHGQTVDGCQDRPSRESFVDFGHVSVRVRDRCTDVGSISGVRFWDNFGMRVFGSGANVKSTGFCSHRL